MLKNQTFPRHGPRSRGTILSRAPTNIIAHAPFQSGRAEANAEPECLGSPYPTSFWISATAAADDQSAAPSIRALSFPSRAMMCVVGIPMPAPRLPQRAMRIEQDRQTGHVMRLEPGRDDLHPAAIGGQRQDRDVVRRQGLDSASATASRRCRADTRWPRS